MVPTIYYFFWVRYHPSRIYSQKKSWQETKYRPPFPSTTKPHPLNPLNRGPTSLVLAGYRLVVLRLFCACSIIFCVCLPRRFYRSKLALFCSTTWLCLISSHVSYCVLSFPLVWLFLHAIPTADTSCCSLFIFILLFHFSSHAYLLYKRIWAFVGQIMLTGSKGSWAQFIFICQSHSARELYFTTDLRFAMIALPCTSFFGPFLLFSLLGGSCFSLGFLPHGTDSKMGINNYIIFIYFSCLQNFKVIEE